MLYEVAQGKHYTGITAGAVKVLLENHEGKIGWGRLFIQHRLFKVFYSDRRIVSVV
jgi:hypothetical protein